MRRGSRRRSSSGPCGCGRGARCRTRRARCRAGRSRQHADLIGAIGVGFVALVCGRADPSAVGALPGLGRCLEGDVGALVVG